MKEVDQIGWFSDPQWWAIIATFIVAVISFFKEKIIDSLFKARVGLEFKILPPNCHKTKLVFTAGDVNKAANCFYYRLKILSLNSVTPKNLELMITKKMIKKGDEFIEDRNFLPMSLKWSHYGKSILDHIPPNLFKFCDFGKIIEPRYSAFFTRQFINKIDSGSVVLDMDLEVQPFTGSHLLIPGIYRFDIALTGQNFNKVDKTFEINMPDFWSEEEDSMLNDGLSVCEV